MLPTFPIKLTHDPAYSTRNVRAVWAIPAGRLLVLLWRPRHFCTELWYEAALPIARQIQYRRPRDAAALFECFRKHCRGGQDRLDFLPADSQAFAQETYEFFAGQRFVPYTIESEASADDQE